MEDQTLIHGKQLAALSRIVSRRFSLRSLLLLVLVVAIVSAIVRWHLSAAPDLVITDVRFQPATPLPGELVGTIITFKNIGRRTAENFYLYQSESTGTSHDGVGWGLGGSVLKPGEEDEYHWGAIKFGETGVHKLMFSIDKENTVKESNEENNVLAIDLLIQASQDAN